MTSAEETLEPELVEQLVRSAIEHGENTEGREMTLGDLEQMLAVAIDIMTPQQTLRFIANLASELGDVPEYSWLYGGDEDDEEPEDDEED